MEGDLLDVNERRFKHAHKNIDKKVGPMPSYNAPIEDMMFVLGEVLDLSDKLKSWPLHQEFDLETLQEILKQGARFASEVIQPLNQVGDEQGCELEHQTHEVKTPEGFREAYKAFIEGGWTSISCDPLYGGQGLPMVVNQCVYEMLNAANQAWTMYAGLTHGAYECLHTHGTQWQKSTFLPKLTCGEWTGTMCLTETQCGTDLGLISTKALPQDDGTYALTGQKIFISAGEHDLADNIVHLVLARLPDAPKGVKGISLFLVSKFLVQDNGSLGARNGIFCSALEHKMGIKGSATCQMTLEAATGTLVGEANRGLAAMFVMMNAARIGVGMQSLGLTEVAYQNALMYAKERIQSRSLLGAKDLTRAADPILVHPDVRRLLLTAKAYSEGGRALSLYSAMLMDESVNAPQESVRELAHRELAFLTPIVKAFLTDNAWISTSACMQVFGGHGYIRDWGVEQFVRDSRINMIYEGTNAIQSLDLLGRKVLANEAQSLKLFDAQVRSFLEQAQSSEHAQEMQVFVKSLKTLSQRIEQVTGELGFKALQNANEVGAAAVDYLRLLGHFVMGYLWAKMALVAYSKAQGTSGLTFYEGKIQLAHFYFAKLMPETLSLLEQIKSGAASLMDTHSVLEDGA